MRVVRINKRLIAKSPKRGPYDNYIESVRCVNKVIINLGCRLYEPFQKFSNAWNNFCCELNKEIIEGKK